jgi:hypothetical protein
MCSLRFENNLFTIEGVRFASILKKTPLSKLSFAFVSLALPLLYHTLLYEILALQNMSISYYFYFFCLTIFAFRALLRIRIRGIHMFLGLPDLDPIAIKPKIGRKTLIPTVLWLLFHFLS